MKRDTLNTWTRWVDDAGCTRCFQHKDLQRKMLQSTLKDTDALDVVDLVVFFGLSMIEHIYGILWVCQCISKHWPLNKTYQTSPDTLETRPPKTRNPQTWLHLINYTEISWKSWQKAFNLQVSFAATSRALPGRCDTLRIDTVYCQKRLQVVERNDFLDLLQICVQSLTNGSIYRILEIKTVSIDLPGLTRNSKLGMADALSIIFSLRTWFICPHPQDFPSSHAKNAAVASQAERLTTGPRRGATSRWWASCAQPLGSRSGAMTKINHDGHISYY